MITGKKREKNEIVIFLTNLFFMEIIGKVTVMAVIWIFRFFGMPQLYNLYYSNAKSPKWIFCTILLIATGISIIRIISKRHKNKRKIMFRNK